MHGAAHASPHVARRAIAPCRPPTCAAAYARPAPRRGVDQTAYARRGRGTCSSAAFASPSPAVDMSSPKRRIETDVMKLCVRRRAAAVVSVTQRAARQHDDGLRGDPRSRKHDGVLRQVPRPARQCVACAGRPHRATVGPPPALSTRPCLRATQRRTRTASGRCTSTSTRRIRTSRRPSAS